MCVYVCMYACMYVCMYACMYVYMYVCMCVCTCGLNKAINMVNTYRPPKDITDKYNNVAREICPLQKTLEASNITIQEALFHNTSII